MKAGAVLAGGDDLDHASELAAVLGRIAARENAHAAHVFGADLGRERGRTVVRHREPVDDELGLVFGTARVQDAVGFDQPSGLRIHQVGQRASRQRRPPLRQGLGADAIHRHGLMRIEQRLSRRDGHLRLERGHAHRHPIRSRERRLDGDHAGERREPLARHGHAIRSERKPLDRQAPLVIGLEVFADLVGLAHQFHGTLECEPGGVDDGETQLSRVGLAELRHRDDEDGR